MGSEAAPATGAAWAGGFGAGSAVALGPGGSLALLLACIAAAALLEYGIATGLRAGLLRLRPLGGDHGDAVIYQRTLWTPGAPAVSAALCLLAAAGAIAWTALALGSWPLWTAALPWTAALAWDLWTWERVGGSVKFVVWRRGWRQSPRRAAVSALKEVHVIERRHGPDIVPWRWRPVSGYLLLVLDDGKAVKLPRTGCAFGGRARLQRVANHTRMQMDVVADARRRRIADKRAAARRQRLPHDPVHPSAKVDPLGFGQRLH